MCDDGIVHCHIGRGHALARMYPGLPSPTDPLQADRETRPLTGRTTTGRTPLDLEA